MTLTRPRKKFRLPNWRQVLLGVLFGAVWGTIPGVYDRWKARSDYDRQFAKLLELPSSISRPRAFLQRMPGVDGNALWIDFYQPNTDEDDGLRAWFVRHDGFSMFQSRYKHVPKPISDWYAVRGNKFITISRSEDNGWVHISFGQRMSPDDATKDLDNFPWKSVLRELRSHDEE